MIKHWLNVLQLIRSNYLDTSIIINSICCMITVFTFNWEKNSIIHLVDLVSRVFQYFFIFMYEWHISSKDKWKQISFETSHMRELHSLESQETALIQETNAQDQVRKCLWTWHWIPSNCRVPTKSRCPLSGDEGAGCVFSKMISWKISHKVYISNCRTIV